MEKTNQGPINIGNSAGIHHPFHISTKKGKKPRPIVMTKEETRLVDQEIQEMFRKGATTTTEYMENHFLSSLFLVGKKDGGSVQLSISNS